MAERWQPPCRGTDCQGLARIGGRWEKKTGSRWERRGAGIHDVEGALAAKHVHRLEVEPLVVRPLVSSLGERLRRGEGSGTQYWVWRRDKNTDPPSLPIPPSSSSNLDGGAVSKTAPKTNRAFLESYHGPLIMDPGYSPRRLSTLPVISPRIAC